MIDYEKIYVDFYSKYYTKAELLIKSYLKERKSQNKGFGKVNGLVSTYLNNALKNKYNLHENEKLIEMYLLFGTRYIEYESNEIQEIFAKEIKTAFSKIEPLELPTNYTYFKLIKEIAVIEALKEISRLYYNHTTLYTMFYKLNEFDEFEIREHRGVSLENYPVYKKMHRILYPDYYIPFIKMQDPEFLETEKIEFEDKKVNFDPNHFNKKGFDLFLYLVENYTIKEQQKIKYINLWYFLKRKVNTDIYTFSFTQKKYVEFIDGKYSTEIKKFAKAEYDFIEQLTILSSLEEQFRNQKFR